MNAVTAENLQETFSTLEQALQTCASLEQEKSALTQEKSELRRQVEDLRVKLAGSEKIVLEKVAGVVLDPALVTATLRQLADLSMVAPDAIEKIAAQLQKDPNGALRLVQRVATLSAPSHSEGRAVEKSAVNSTPSDPDGKWW
jgi:chromosome segregation ATPase